MLHEPKFWAIIFFLGELLAGGIAAVMEKHRKIGFAAMGMATLGLLAIFFFWPEVEPESTRTATSIKQEGTTTNSPNVVGDHNSVNMSGGNGGWGGGGGGAGAGSKTGGLGGNGGIVIKYWPIATATATATPAPRLPRNHQPRFIKVEKSITVQTSLVVAIP